MKRNFLNLIKSIYKKPMTNIYTVGYEERLNFYTWKLETDQECSLSLLLFNKKLEVMSSAIREGINGIHAEINEIVIIFRWHDSEDIENSKKCL